ncbi:hypothetical protein [Pectobacterium parvum]|uniref:hypothetical protein n=1 Tax=Pectobacterium parvum TaxID=2778550 RepID=UPI00058048C8|nr:hypothetical protein [Pectobacterium parvum]KHS95608.1 hypothetical protein RC88_10045 [Pectobacterium parvum]GKW41731.1 hypothetical protein PEC301879_15890 [Pectobacterium carotovorum subsp. carotovorum]
MTIISIKRMGGGLNNQKMMLLALLITAIETNSEIKLPYLINYVTNKKDNTFKKYIYRKLIYPLFDRYVPFFKIFDKSLFVLLLEKYKIKISSKTSNIKYSNEKMFEKGSAIIDEFLKKNNHQHKHFIMDFFKHLQPSSYMKNKIDFFTDQSLPFDAICQLRIEDDWPLNVDSNWSEKDDQKKLPSQVMRSIDIFNKIYNTLPNLKNIYVTYDKNGLKTPFSLISDTIKDKFGYTLKAKHLSKNKNLNPKNALEASVIDFEMSVQTDIYIGTEMSSFTILSNLTKECRELNFPVHRYFYGTKEDRLSIYIRNVGY